MNDLSNPSDLDGNQSPTCGGRSFWSIVDGRYSAMMALFCVGWIFAIWLWSVYDLRRLQDENRRRDAVSAKEVDSAKIGDAKFERHSGESPP
jgi:hypothetical protein